MPSASPPARRRWAVLAVLCLAVFVINVSTTIVNVALPTLVGELGASTRDLLWIVDAFNLAFAALVLAAGSLSDRFGRRRFLLGGLAVFAAASLAGAWSESPAELTAWRAVAGIGAAVIFPVTLSIVANVFPDRVQRAKAIGIWGATTGVAVALGPIAGGWLLERFWWGSILVFCAGVAAAAFLLTAALVPDSRDPSTPRLDAGGLVLSTLGLGALVRAIIEAPGNGWSSAATLVGFGVAAACLTAFVLWERRTPHPMLDVSLFANLRFTAASGAVTLSFFALFGFIFLITQYFQFLKGYGPFETGVRLLPVALCVAFWSIAGARLAVAIGTKAVVAAGLLSLTAAYAWISTVGTGTSYAEIAGQMILLGSGMGLTSAPATEAIMGVVPAAKAGIGSAVNDATRELGGTLGVAVIGSVALSLYRDAFAGSGLPPAAAESVGAALNGAGRIGASDPVLAARLGSVAREGFLDGLAAGCYVAAGVALAGAVLTVIFLPAQPGAVHVAPSLAVPAEAEA